MASNEGSSVVDRSSWPRWLIAVLVGAPVIGAGYYYLTRRRKSHLKKDSREEEEKKRTAADGGSARVGQQPPAQPQPQTPLDRALSLKNSGNALFNREKPEDAIRCYSEAISVCPPENRDVLSVLYQNRAAAYDAMNKLQEVLEDCNKALELNPHYIKALNRRYKVTEKLGKFRQSLEDITAVCLLEKFENINSLSNADRVLKKLGKELAKQKKASRVPMLPSSTFIKTYFGSYKNDPSIQRIKEQLEEQSGDVPLSGVLAAKKAFLEGRYEDVIQSCNEQLAMDASNGDTSTADHYQALLIRASLYILRTQSEQAMQDLNVIINDRISDIKLVVTALIKRATIHLEFEDFEKCMEDFALAESLDPNNVDVLYNRAQVFLLTEKLVESVSDFDRAVENCPDFGLLVVQSCYTKYRLAVTTNDMNQVQAAIRNLKEAADKYADIIEGYLLLGQAEADRGNFEEADKAFQTAIDRQPNNATLLVHKGLLELQWRGNVEKSMEYFEKAVELDSKCELAFETLASVEVQRGNFARAVELYDRALQIARSEGELMHIYNLKEAVEVQQTVAERLGLPLQLMMANAAK